MASKSRKRLPPSLGEAASLHIEMGRADLELLDFFETANAYLPLVSLEMRAEIAAQDVERDAVAALVAAATAVGARAGRHLENIALLDVRARRCAASVAIDRPSCAAAAALLCLGLCGVFVGNMRLSNLYVDQAHTMCLSLPKFPLHLQVAIEHLSYVWTPIPLRQAASWWPNARLRALHASNVAMSALALLLPPLAPLPDSQPFAQQQRQRQEVVFDGPRLATLEICARELATSVGSFGHDGVGTLVCGGLASLLLLAIGRVSESRQHLVPVVALLRAKPSLCHVLPLAWTVTVAVAGLCCVHGEFEAYERLYAALANDPGAGDAEKAAAGSGGCAMPMPATTREMYLAHRCPRIGVCDVVVQAAQRALTLRHSAAAATHATAKPAAGTLSRSSSESKLANWAPDGAFLQRRIQMQPTQGATAAAAAAAAAPQWPWPSPLEARGLVPNREKESWSPLGNDGGDSGGPSGGGGGGPSGGGGGGPSGGGGGVHHSLPEDSPALQHQTMSWQLPLEVDFKQGSSAASGGSTVGGDSGSSDSFESFGPPPMPTGHASGLAVRMAAPQAAAAAAAAAANQELYPKPYGETMLHEGGLTFPVSASMADAGGAGSGFAHPFADEESNVDSFFGGGAAHDDAGSSETSALYSTLLSLSNANSPMTPAGNSDEPAAAGAGAAAAAAAAGQPRSNPFWGSGPAEL